MNSPTKPFVKGSATEPNRITMNKTANFGATFAKPPDVYKRQHPTFAEAIKEAALDATSKIAIHM